MRIIVDRDRCTGIGICESIDPDRFEVGDDGVLTLLNEHADPADRELLDEAVRSCPAAALRIDEVS